jgi:hypothetical protein
MYCFEVYKTVLDKPKKWLRVSLKGLKRAILITNSKSVIFGHLSVTFQKLYLHGYSGSVKKSV